MAWDPRSGAFLFDALGGILPPPAESDETPLLENTEQGDETNLVYSKCETELQVRPDDIPCSARPQQSDLNYVLAARLDLMERCYAMPMAEFQKQGYAWSIAATQMNFRQSLKMGDRFMVCCWIEVFTLIGLRMRFEIDRVAGAQRCCDGWFDCVMVSLENARCV